MRRIRNDGEPRARSKLVSHQLFDNIDHFIGPDRGWIAAQLALFGLAGAAPLAELTIRGRAIDIPLLAHIVPGIVLLVGAGAIVLKARLDLAENFRMSPTPVDRGRLVDHGIYGVVRHPMYLAAMMALAGWSFAVLVWSAAVVVVVGFSFFTLKSRYEEAKLLETYSEYQEYRHHVTSRFIPFLW